MPATDVATTPSKVAIRSGITEWLVMPSSPARTARAAGCHRSIRRAHGQSANCQSQASSRSSATAVAGFHRARHRQAYRLKASNAVPPISTFSGPIPARLTSPVATPFAVKHKVQASLRRAFNTWRLKTRPLYYKPEIACQCRSHHLERACRTARAAGRQRRR
jgi:hypothetical protein